MNAMDSVSRKAPRSIPSWIHRITILTLILVVLFLDVYELLGLSWSIFWLVPVVYAAWALHGIEKVLFLLLILGIVLLVEILSDPQTIRVDQLLNRFYGVLAGAFVVYLISERHRYIVALQQANNELELQVTQRTQQLTEVNQRAEGNLALLQTLIRNSPAGIAFINREYQFLQINESLAKITGYPPASLLGQSLKELRPNLWSSIEPIVGKVMESGQPITGIDLEIDTGDLPGKKRHLIGGYYPVLDSSNVLFGIGILLIDVTEQKQIETELRKSDDRYRAFISQSTEGIWRYEVDPGIPIDLTPEEQAERFLASAVLGECNYPMAKMYGYSSPEGLIGKPFRDFLTPSDTKVFDRVRMFVRNGYRVVDSETREPDIEGHDRIFLNNGMGIIEENKLVRVWGTQRDITERKMAEESLRKTRAMLERILNNIPEGVFWKDRESRYLGCNFVVSRAFGVESPQQLIGKNDYELPGLNQDQAAFFIEKDQYVINSGLPLYGIVESATLPDGTTIWLETNKLPIRDDRGQVIGILGTWHDITEKRKLEEQLRQAQKMEAVGRLAGGVAHDFNNLLTVINGYTDLVLTTIAADDLNREAIEEVRKAGERAASLTGQLLAFSRKQMLQPKLLNLNEVVQQCEKLLRRLIGEDILLTCILPPLGHQIKVDPGQIELVIVNLAVNARDAMPQGGILTIETREVDIFEEQLRVDPELKVGRFVILSISDTGCGMTKEVQERIFEPFYTTKEQGKGTGLGLATVYGIVAQSEGFIILNSQVGIGTTFRIYLPVALERSNEPIPEVVPPMTLMGNETVLVVEDEPAVRSLAMLVLSNYGYKPVEAPGGSEAIQILENYPREIDLLISDVVMPEMSGRQLAEVLRAKNPSLKVLFISGYMDDAVVRHGIYEDEVAFLNKPFSPTTFIKKVREVLNGD
jgi:two-component system, cell cycle sensor histidine kinase and response regulator CckA